MRAPAGIPRSRFTLARYTLRLGLCVPSPPFRVSVLSLGRAGTKSHPFGVPRDSTSCSEQAVFLCFKCRGYVRTPIHPAEPGSKAPPVLKLPRRPSDPPAATLRDGRHLPSTCRGPGAVLSTSVWFLLCPHDPASGYGYSRHWWARLGQVK